MPLGPFLRRPSGRAPLHIAVLLLVACGIAPAQFSTSPGVINMGAILGSTIPVSASAPVFVDGVAGPRNDFHLSIRYAGPVEGWLSYSVTTGTTPTYAILTANPSRLPAGTYLAQLVAEFSAVNGSQVTTVLLTVAPGGSNANALAATPSGLVFLPDAMDPQTLTVMNAPGVTGVIPFTSFATSTGWLSITQADQAAPGKIKVQVDPTGVSPGIHTGTVTIRTAAANNTVVPVSIVVRESGIGSNIVLTPAQQALTFNVQTGTTLNPTQTMYISSGSTQYTYFSAGTSDSWMGVSAASWMTPARTTLAFAPGLLYVSVDPAGLSPGTYRGTLTLSANGSAINVPVTLNVSTTAVLNANPSFVSLDADSNSLTANVAVTASDAFYFTASVSANTGWLSVLPANAIASNSITNLTLTAKPDGLPRGTYTGAVTLIGPNGSPTLTVPVQFKVGGTAAANSVSTSPSSLEFSTIADGPIPPQYLVISTTAFLTESYALAAISDEGWLNVDPLVGSTPLLATVTVNPATPAGTYAGSILVTSLTTGGQATVKVKFTSVARVMTATPAVLQFSQPFHGPAPAPQQVQVRANALSAFRVTAQPAWVKVSPAGPYTTPVKLVVTADPTGMTPGSYEGTIRLSGPTTINIQASLTVDGPPPAAVSPSSVTFTYELGAPAPAPQSVSVTNPAVSTAFAAVASTTSGTNWLTVTPDSGSTPGAITVGLKTGQLTPGQHTGTVTVTFGSSGVAPMAIPVNLTVTGSPIQVREVLNAATLAPTSIAPGQIVTLTGIGIGPSTPAVARATAAGAYATELAGIQALFDGVAAPLLMAQDGQINAIVPYALDGRPSARVQVQVGTSYSVPIDVKVAAAAPGIFTAGGSGRGQAAALNGDSTPNSVLNAAQRGTVIVVYMTGEGQTDPPGQDGRVISSDVRKPLAPVTASIGGVPAQVLYAGSAPNQVAGMCQVNIRIPETADPGTQPIEVRVGGIPSQNGVTIELR